MKQSRLRSLKSCIGARSEYKEEDIETDMEKQTPKTPAGVTHLKPKGRRVEKGRNTGEALCLGHRRTQSLNTVMEWNSKRMSHHRAPLFHHSSLLYSPPPLFLVTFSNLLMCSRCAAVCLLLNNWELCHICQGLSFPLLSLIPSLLVVSFGAYSLSFPSILLFLPPSSPNPFQL